jgi:hypothetical protein
MMKGLFALALAALAAPASAHVPPAQINPAIYTDPPHDKAHPAAMEVLHIPSGGVRINGLAYFAAGAGPHPVLVLMHGLPGNEKNLDLAQAVRRAGMERRHVQLSRLVGKPRRLPLRRQSRGRARRPRLPARSRQCRASRNRPEAHRRRRPFDGRLGDRDDRRARS